LIYSNFKDNITEIGFLMFSFRLLVFGLLVWGEWW